MAVRFRVKEVAREKGISMGKLQRSADVAYNTIKRMYRDPYYITTTETLGLTTIQGRAESSPMSTPHVVSSMSQLRLTNQSINYSS